MSINILSGAIDVSAALATAQGAADAAQVTADAAIPLTQKGAANGVMALNSNADAVGRFVVTPMTAATFATFIPRAGEIVVVQDAGIISKVYVGQDGVTAGAGIQVWPKVSLTATLTDADPVTGMPDLTYQDATVSLLLTTAVGSAGVADATRVLPDPTTAAPVGRRLTVKVTQVPSGAKQDLWFGSRTGTGHYRFTAGNAPTITQTFNAVDIFVFEKVTGNPGHLWYCVSNMPDSH